jgi:antitoxin (DNA-binding transcriptional repressor) of toxin-antitoxin stability system
MIMKDIGIRELKARASHWVRSVSENHATYAITRRGKTVGLLVPPEFQNSSSLKGADAGWDRLLTLRDQLESEKGRKPSALRALAEMRR